MNVKPVFDCLIFECHCYGWLLFTNGAGPGVEEEDPLISRVDGEVSSDSNADFSLRRFGYSLSGVKCFGVDLTPDNVAIAMVYFVQGVLGLAKLAVSFYLKDDLNLDPAEVRCFYILGSFL